MNIKPNEYIPETKGVSGKFSWNIYKFLKKYSRFDIRVYKVGWNSAHGECDIENGQYFIGYHFDEISFTGSFLLPLMCQGQSSVTSCMTAARCESRDVTDWFFSKYKRDGRCFVVGDWSHEWLSVTKNSRKCVHCGEWQNREIKTVKRIDRKEVWK